MKNPVARVELPAGDCKTTRSTKSFSGKEHEVVISCRAEERRFGQTIIREEEKTRVFVSENAISVLRVNLIFEDGAVKKVSEYASAEKCEDKTQVVHRRKMQKNGQLIGSYLLREEQDSEYLIGFKNEVFSKSDFQRAEGCAVRNIFKG